MKKELDFEGGENGITFKQKMALGGVNPFTPGN
jgi:hypothetical protein